MTTQALPATAASAQENAHQYHYKSRRWQNSAGTSGWPSS